MKEHLDYNKVFETRHGLMMCNHMDFFIGTALYLYGESCELALREMLPYINEDSVVLDAGANVGTMAIPFARASLRVFAVEPEFSNYLCLCGNVAINSLSNIIPICSALGDYNGDCYYTPVNPRQPLNIGGTHMEPEHSPGKAVVPIITVDSLDVPFSFIKIDVEGMEDKVLLGAQKTLERHKPVVCCELLFDASAKKSIDVLTGLGYSGWTASTLLFNKDNFNGCEENLFGKVGSHDSIWIHKDSTVKRPEHLCAIS